MMPRSAVAFAALLAFLLALSSCAAAPPPPIRDELARSPRGTVTVVFFTDFQCPFCRRTHAALAPVVAQHPGRVRVVLRHVPLNNHPDARTAARAAVCAESIAAYDDLVHALFTSPDLGEAACEELAVDRGADREQFKRCVADPATDARIDRDTAMLDSLHGDGVPIMYVGRTRLEGSQTRRDIEAAVDDAMRDVGSPSALK